VKFREAKDCGIPFVLLLVDNRIVQFSLGEGRLGESGGGGGRKGPVLTSHIGGFHNIEAKMDKRFHVSRILPGSKQFEI